MLIAATVPRHLFFTNPSALNSSPSLPLNVYFLMCRTKELWFKSARKYERDIYFNRPVALERAPDHNNFLLS